MAPSDVSLTVTCLVLPLPPSSATYSTQSRSPSPTSPQHHSRLPSPFTLHTSISVASLCTTFPLQSATAAKYVSLYEFEHCIGGQVCDVAVTAVCGHVMGYDFHESFRKW